MSLELSHELLFSTPNWGWLEMQKGQTIEDRHEESWGPVCWALDGDAQQPCCFFSLITLLLLRFFSSLFFQALFLHYFLKPCFFSILWHLFP
jgi:hypothetical protein